jgi:hypothetical protein
MFTIKLVTPIFIKLLVYTLNEVRNTFLSWICKINTCITQCLLKIDSRYFETHLKTRFSETRFSPDSGNARAENDVKGILENRLNCCGIVSIAVFRFYRRHSYCYYNAGVGIAQSVYWRAVSLKAGLQFLAMARDSHLFHSKPASYAMGNMGYFSAIKRPGCETDTALYWVKECTYDSNPKQFSWHGDYLIKQTTKAERSLVRDPLRWNFKIFLILRPHYALRFTKPLPEMSTGNIKKKNFWGVKCCRCVGLTILPPSMSWLSRQCGILNISQPNRPPRPVRGIALLYFFF